MTRTNGSGVRLGMRALSREPFRKVGQDDWEGATEVRRMERRSGTESRSHAVTCHGLYLYLLDEMPATIEPRVASLQFTCAKKEGLLQLHPRPSPRATCTSTLGVGEHHTSPASSSWQSTPAAAALPAARAVRSLAVYCVLHQATCRAQGGPWP